MAANPLPIPTLTVTSQKSGDEAVVHCSGKVTMETANQLREVARAAMEGSKRLIVDFSDVSYLDSSGLGTVVGLYITSKKAGCAMRLVNLSPRVKEIFTLTRLGEILEGHEEYLGYTPD